MAKIFYVLALLAAGLGMFEASTALDGSHKQIEAGILLIVAPLLAVAGFIASRASTKVCPACSERVKKSAHICKHCRSNLA